MLEFAWPWALAAAPLPLIAMLLRPASRDESALRVPFYALASDFEAGAARGPRSWPKRALMLIAWALLVGAASHPHWVGEPITLPAQGRDLMLAVDISGSMGTQDMFVNNTAYTRLEIVKTVVGDFVERRQGDRLGLILFGSQAYLQTPLTFDRNTVRSLLIETPRGVAGDKTAIGDAIGLGVKRLLDRPESSRVLILLTDGVNNIGEVAPLKAAELAASQSIRIHTIGFGADQLRVPGLFGSRNVNPSASLDAETLTGIADSTGGVFRRARTTRELLDVYAELDRLEPIDQDAETFRPRQTLFMWPLGAAFAISVLLVLVPLLQGLSGAMRRGEANRPAAGATHAG